MEKTTIEKLMISSLNLYFINHLHLYLDISSHKHTSSHIIHDQNDNSNYKLKKKI